MKTVIFKNKEANHSVCIDGKMIRFVNGEAELEDKAASELVKKADYSLKKSSNRRTGKSNKSKQR